jgi:hypothetical protein
MASLPPVASAHLLGDQGFGNQLLVGVLTDGRQVLLRQNLMPAPPPTARADFLSRHDVGAPRLYAANNAGAVLVEFTPGESLAAVSRRGALSDDVWRMVGEAYQRIHAVEFPAPLRGPFGPERLELAPCDPVALLHSKVEGVEPAVRSQRPTMLSSLARLRDRIDARAAELQREVPCLVHSDANFDNIVVGTDRVTLIDWDYPAVGYPLEELEGLEEHAYLHGVSELPAVFFAGYGREVSRPLLRLHRIVAGLGTFNSEWSDMAADTGILPISGPYSGCGISSSATG